jgi:predicted aspartyl protease
MPVYNQHYPDDNGRINTVGSQDRLAQFGPTIPVAIGLPPATLDLFQSAGLTVPPPVTGLALIDTGASVCVIDDEALTGLGITPSGTMAISTTSGSAVQSTYAASISFPGTPLPSVNFTDFVGSPLQAHGIVALIGRSVLRHFVVIYNGPDGSVSVAY